MSFFTNRRQQDTDTAQLPPDGGRSSHIGFDTVLSETTILDGTLKSEGNIRLDGKFTGKLDITGNVLVGETAVIDADIEARNISIAGKVNGNVSGNKVQILQTGSIHGDIQANSLTTEEGAFIEGNIAMQHTPTVPEPETVDVVEAPESYTTTPIEITDATSDEQAMDESTNDDETMPETPTRDDNNEVMQ
ncbi:MAG: polymer-forming cytoskeletal protein [Chloroflexota bacterium]